MVKHSHAYVVGRVRVLERGLLGKSGRERLLNTQTPKEFYRALSELGWGEVTSQADVERLAAKVVEQACDLVRRYSPEPLVTDCFLIEYDIHNLKMLFKLRALGTPTGQELSPNGLIPPELLRACAREGNWGRIEIPALREAAQALEREVAISVDPLKIDSVLDQAMYRFTKENMDRSFNTQMKQYFSDRADMANLLIVLRARQMGRGVEFARKLLVTGGQLGEDVLLPLTDASKDFSKAVRGMPYERAMRKGYAAYLEGRSLSVMEKLRDDYLLSLIRPHRYEPLTLLPLIGYLLAKEREAAMVRLILSARLSGFPSDQLLERLREDYAG